MNRRRDPLLVLAALLFAAASGCAVADTGSFVRLQEDIEKLKREVASVRAAAPRPASSPQPARIEPVEMDEFRKSLADLSADTDRVKSDVLATATRADEAKLDMQKEVSRLNEATADLGQSVQEIKAKVAAAGEVERRVGVLEEKVARLASAQPAQASPQSHAGSEWKSPEEMYEHALGLVKSGDTRKGRDILSAFAARHPDHRLMQNVHYWKGESFYTEKDYENAILSFQDVVDKYPGGDKAPDAMLKQGYSFQALNDSKNAKVIFELLQARYPKSKAAELARQRLSELK